MDREGFATGVPVVTCAKAASSPSRQALRVNRRTPNCATMSRRGIRLLEVFHGGGHVGEACVDQGEDGIFFEGAVAVALASRGAG